MMVGAGVPDTVRSCVASVCLRCEVWTGEPSLRCMKGARYASSHNETRRQVLASRSLSQPFAAAFDYFVEAIVDEVSPR
jgi:hypothetical protein